MEEKYGEVEEMNVCDNLGDHLVGNVYVKVSMILRNPQKLLKRELCSNCKTSNILVHNSSVMKRMLRRL